MGRGFTILFICPFEKLWYEKQVHYHYTDFGAIFNYFKTKKLYLMKLMDGVAVSNTKGDLVNVVTQGLDLCVVLSHLHNIREACEISRICKDVSPTTKTLVYGPATAYATSFFIDNGFDACVIAGDWK